ncbi:hypothetical protein [Serinibacter salmoneus]|uniref:Uncharacterized protein n=1 Tax=Serinibacter salmoneus TaxID=556530 RepID=A0A2A9D439_9MICO|nr:hypothetical protein [Serinibacter salmoneus]PFG21096.1 hypothetical protein ATL40_2716 [Serinibacter salmoneus]
MNAHTLNTDRADVRVTILATYRSLRVGIVCAGALLLTSVTLEVVRVGAVPASISALFYSPVRTVFVGVLIAVGLALVAVQGRVRWENSLLDAAGVLVPLVAFVPTPLFAGTGAPSEGSPLWRVGADCAGGEACVPADLHVGIGNNVASYGLLGAITLVLLWAHRLHARRSAGASGQVPSLRSVTIATVIWVALGAWFVLARESFIAFGHNVSAIGFFALLIVVVVINARDATDGPAALSMGRSGFRRTYLVIAGAMGVAVVAGVGTFLFTGEQSAFALVFWLEVVLLVLFIAFWVAQTIEHWDHDVVDAAA